MSGRNDTTETTDPARRLALLWGDRRHSARRGKHQLNLATIVAAGIALADESGVTALSMRKVAERLGVGTMSLYTYVPGKEDLVEVMVDTVYAEIAAGGQRGGASTQVDGDAAADGPGRDATARTGQGDESPRADAGPSFHRETRPKGTDVEPRWRRRLAALAWESFRAHVAHAWLLRLPTGRAVLGPGAAAKYELELATIDDTGLSDVDMDGVVSLVGGHVVASAKRVADAAESQRSTGMTEEQWWRANEPLLAAFADPSRFPTASRVGAAAGNAHQSAYAADGGFAFGLGRILDGVSLLVDACGGGRPQARRPGRIP